MADIPFVDTHFHLHDMKHPELRYGWLEPDAVHGFLGNIDAIKAQHYWIKDYIAEIRFANVPKAIHVQAALGTPDPVDETKWLQAFADRPAIRRASSPNAILPAATPKPCSNGICEYANVRGIRDFGKGRYLVDPAWRAGFKFLERHNLVSCIDTRVELFDDLLDLAAAFPNILICVDHCAIPEARDDAYFGAGGGDAETRARRQRRDEDLRPRHGGPAVDGRRRSVPGCSAASRPSAPIGSSSAPTGRSTACSAPIPTSINAYAEIISGFTEDEQTAMFSGNAERFFRI